MSGAFPAVPNTHALAAMLLTVVALYLFSRDRYPIEVTSLVLLAVLALGFSLFPFQVDGESFEATRFFEGFGHEALVAVVALMVVGQGLVRTGALEPVGRLLTRCWRSSPSLSFLMTMVLGGVLSAFVNNTPIVVLLMPILVSVCLQTDSSPARVLMPMNFSTLAGGMATTIGTSTNLLVVGIAADLGMRRFGMFDFAFPAAAAFAVALGYLWLLAPRLLPARAIDLASGSPRLFEATLELDEDSDATGRTVAEAVESTGGSMYIARIRRGDNLLYPLPDARLRAGDRLRVQDTSARLKRFEEALGATLHSGDRPVDADHPLQAADQQLAEIAVVQGSLLDRTKLRYARFLKRYRLVVLAVHRGGENILDHGERIQDVVLVPGDVLLVQGARAQIAELKESRDFLVLDATVDLPRTGKAPLALGILLLVVGTAAVGVVPISVGATAGATAMVVTGCLPFGDAVRAVTPSVVLVVVASLALGRALLDTGATDYLAEVFLTLTAGTSATVVLSGLMLLLALLTNVVSNNAAAVIGTPIALGIAARLSLPPEPFVLAVLFGANMSYATPMAYKTNLLVMSAGDYRFSEFLKVGVPLVLLMWMVLSWMLTLLYL